MTRLASPTQLHATASPPASPRSLHHHTRSWIPLALLVPIILAGAVLRGSGLGVPSLWFDEGYTAWAISLPPHQLIRAIQVDTAPPLFYLLLKGWAAMAGRSEAALRSLSAMCSVGALLLCWLTARRLLRDRWATLAATALAAGAYMPVAYAHEARFYAMMMLLAALDFYLVLLVAERASLPRLALLCLSWIASLYTNNALLVYVAACAAAWLAAPGLVGRRRRIMQLAAVGSLAALAFSPWVPSLLAQHRAIAANFWASPPSVHNLCDTACSLAGISPYAWRPLRGVVFAVDSVVLAAWGTALLLLPRARPTLAILGLMAAAPVLLLFVLSRVGQPVFVDRIFIASCAFLPVILAAPLAFVRRGGLRAAWVGVLIVLLAGEVWSLRGQWLGEHQEDWRSATEFLAWQRADAGGRSLVVFTANEGEMLYDYYARHGDYTPAPDLLGTPTDFFHPRDGGMPRTMRRIRSAADLAPLQAVLSAGGFDRIFLVASHQEWADPLQSVKGLLNHELHLRRRRDFDHVSVFEFDRVP
jgi:hypothetical protein